MFNRGLLSFLFAVLMLTLSAQTDLAKKENKTITKIDLLKIQRITDFFPGLPEKFKYLSGTLVCKTGGETYHEECKTEQLSEHQKELLKFSDPNTKIYADIK